MAPASRRGGRGGGAARITLIVLFFAQKRVKCKSYVSFIATLCTAINYTSGAEVGRLRKQQRLPPTDCADITTI